MMHATAWLADRAQTGAVTSDGSDPAPRPERRRFTAAHQAEVVAEYDSHPQAAQERDAILGREGL